MSLKGNKLYSIAFNKCPRCHEGKLFDTNNPYNLAKGLKMKKECECCKQPYEPEPYFYTGAMYISYGITVLITAIVFASIAIFSEKKPSLLEFTLIETVALGIMIPITFRIARSIWLNIFVHYEKTNVPHKT